MPEELFKLLTSLSTTFEFPFTTDFIKTNYRRAKKLWLDTEEDFEIASPSDPLTITYSSDTQKYSFGLLYIYRQLNGKRNCGLCKKNCGQVHNNAIKIERQKIFSAYSKSNEVLMKSSSAIRGFLP